MMATPWVAVVATTLLISACTSTGEKHQTPPAFTERSIIYHDHLFFLPFETRYTIRIREIDRLPSVYMIEPDWLRVEKPAGVDEDNTVAVAVSPGSRKLLVSACRDNWIPFCDYKCALSVMRLDAKANGLYELKVRIGDEESKFRIVNAYSSETVTGPVVEESNCSMSQLGP